MVGRAPPLLLCACACACAAVLACRTDTDRVAAAAERAQPHLEGFRRFDRWARRALAGDAVPRDRDALGEVVFAPIRATPELLAAWVALEDDRPRVLALPAGVAPPPEAQWIALRDPELGALRVASLAPCPLRLPPKWRKEPIAGCVLIAHAAAAGPVARALTVTLAYRTTD